MFSVEFVSLFTEICSGGSVWGTSGQRILSEFSLDPFTKMELIRDGVLVFGRDFRNLLSFPSRAEVLRAI